MVGHFPKFATTATRGCSHCLSVTCLLTLSLCLYTPNGSTGPQYNRVLCVCDRDKYLHILDELHHHCPHSRMTWHFPWFSSFSPFSKGHYLHGMCILLWSFGLWMPPGDIMRDIPLKTFPKMKVKRNKESAWNKMWVLQGFDHPTIMRPISPPPFSP